MEDKTLATSESTKLSTFKPTENMIRWKDIAIQIRKLSPSDIAETCGFVYSHRKSETWRQEYYKSWLKIEEFKPWFLQEYANHFKKELSAKAYARLHDRVELEKDMSKIIEVIDLVEGNARGNTNIQVNIPILGGKSLDAISSDNSNPQDSQS